MAKSNRERVGEIMDLLKAGLTPFVIQQYRSRYRGKYLQEMELKLYNPPFSVSLPDEATALERLDTQACLKLMVFNWKEAFKDKLGNADRSYANELMTARNAWAHQKSAFSNEEARRVADTARLLLQAVNATEESAGAAGIYNELSRLLYERQATKAASAPPKAQYAERTTDPALKPWRLVLAPHEDVRKGSYRQAEFAADLAAVMRGQAQIEYADAREFFRRTYLTAGLRDLLANGVKRLSGAGGDPVVQLQTNFGGGKTHSLLALYHAFGSDITLSEIRDFDEIRNLVGAIDDDLQAQRAVIVGTSFNVSKARDHGDCSTRTIWGEIAYQLGGLAAYELVESNDLEGTNPGADTLTQLLEAHGPALIIMDELVRLTQQLYGVTRTPSAGSFEAILAFMQSLTEAVKRSSDALLLVSIPASDIEIGGEGGLTSLARLRQTLGRVESVWKPVGREESYEIVRRRLFGEVQDYPARDAVIKAYFKMYSGSRSEYPQSAVEGDYRERMRQAYPIHPELFDRLYEDWSTLDRFQRTRGVLRMMAYVIHSLWVDNDQSLMIMPGAIPLWQPLVQGEITQYLADPFATVVDTDIDGQGSKPFQLDREVRQLGKFSASRRVARAIFMGSAPTVRAQNVRGVEERRILLGTVQPGESPAVFSDALRRMSNQLTYLYSDGSRYWYDTRPTVNRAAQELARGMESYEVLAEAAKRLRAQPWSPAELGHALFLPQSSADIPDEQRARVVVLSPESAHRRKDPQSSAMRVIRDFLENRGKAPRHHKNTLLFLAADQSRYAEWEESIRAYLAWTRIEREQANYNLDRWQLSQARQAIERENSAVEKRMQETYCWLIAPDQAEASQPIQLIPERIRASDNFLSGAARKIHSNSWLVSDWSPDMLLMELEPLDIWRDEPHLRILILWEWLTKYCYLPRLFGRKVLEEAIKEGVNRIGPAFGYASRVNEDGSYAGLKWQEAVTPHFDEQAVIVQREAAETQRQAELAAMQPPEIQEAPEQPAVAAPSQEIHEAPPIKPPAPKRKTRYHGRSRIDPQRPFTDVGNIREEILELLNSLKGTEVEVTIEIRSRRPAGFDEATVRAISENSRSLNFEEHSFEE